MMPENNMTLDDYNEELKSYIAWSKSDDELRQDLQSFNDRIRNFEVLRYNINKRLDLLYIAKARASLVLAEHDPTFAENL